MLWRVRKQHHLQALLGQPDNGVVAVVSGKQLLLHAPGSKLHEGFVNDMWAAHFNFDAQQMQVLSFSSRQDEIEGKRLERMSDSSSVREAWHSMTILCCNAGVKFNDETHLDARCRILENICSQH